MGQALPAGLSAAEEAAVFGEEGPTMKRVAEKIQAGDIRRVLAVVGAGASVAAGIPDFRSPSTGLYQSSVLQTYDLPHPEAVFDIDYFQEDPKPFFHLARELLPASVRPTRVHAFLRLLADSGVLLRVYTQNIDCLEREAGIPEDKIVETHGSFETATCQSCYRRYSKQYIRRILETAVVEQDELRVPIPRCELCDGVVKPDITFFGEQLPRRFHELSPSDCREADLLMVIGTSLEVQPVASLPQRVDPRCPRILFNLEPVGVEHRRHDPLDPLADLDDATMERLLSLGGSGVHDDDLSLEERERREEALEDIFGTTGGFRFDREDNYRDVFVEGDCDKTILDFAKCLEWDESLESRRLALQTPSSPEADRSPDSGDDEESPQEVSPSTTGVEPMRTYSGRLDEVWGGAPTAEAQQAAEERLRRGGMDIAASAEEDVGGVTECDASVEQAERYPRAGPRV